MTSEEHFLRAIREAPEDDDLRLVFADWLDERGDPRGELMRLQVQRARHAADEGSLLQVPPRERELLERHAAAWIGPLAQHLRSSFFLRGLLFLEMPATRFIRAASLRVAQANWDWVDGVRLHGAEGRLEKVLAVRRLASFSYFDLGGNLIGDAGATLLADTAALAHLVHLGLDACNIGPAGATALAASGVEHRLLTLDLSSNPLGPAGVRALARLPAFPRLRTLCLGSTQAGDEGAACLAASEMLAQLERLDLPSNGIGDRGARALAVSPFLAGLKHLDLVGNAISEPGRDALRERFGSRVAF